MRSPNTRTIILLKKNSIGIVWARTCAAAGQNDLLAGRKDDKSFFLPWGDSDQTTRDNSFLSLRAYEIFDLTKRMPFAPCQFGQANAVQFCVMTYICGSILHSFHFFNGNSVEPALLVTKDTYYTANSSFRCLEP